MQPKLLKRCLLLQTVAWYQRTRVTQNSLFHVQIIMNDQTISDSCFYYKCPISTVLYCIVMSRALIGSSLFSPLLEKCAATAALWQAVCNKKSSALRKLTSTPCKLTLAPCKLTLALRKGLVADKIFFFFF